MAITLWAGVAPSACGMPADAAIAHLEKIVKADVNLQVGTDTAISPHVSITKKSQIEDRLKRMAIDLEDGVFESGDVRIDGDLAGVIVHKHKGYDPEKIAAFAVALVKTDGRWLPAPVPASFENTGVSMDFELRRRAVELERWMLRERSRALDTLRDKQAERIRADIASAITQEELESKSVSQMAQAFLDASRNRDRLRLLGMLGGLSQPLPGDWATRLRAVEQAVTAPASAPKGWRALTSPEVARVIVFEETGVRDGLFTIGFLDPAGEVPRGGVPAVDLLHINMERDSAGLWQINLPSRLTDAEAARIAGQEENNPFDHELLDAFPTRLRESQPTTAQDTPEALWEKMQDALKSQSPDGLLQLLSIPDDAAQARIAIGRVARFWWQLRSVNGGRVVVPLAFHHQDDQALAMAQIFTFRDPERLDLRAFHMVRLADGWMWQSTGRQKPPHPISEALISWRDQQDVHWRTNWITALLKSTVKLDTLKSGSPVDAAIAETMLRKLLESIETGDLNACLGLSAVLDDEEGHARLLRNLGYELATQITEIEGEMVTHSGKHWTVVCYRRRDDMNPGMALIPIVTTPDGPRILLELDLFVGTRQRDFLNNVALERLEGYAEDEVREDLKNLLQKLNRELVPRRE